MNVRFEQFQADFFLWKIETSSFGGIEITRRCKDKSGYERVIGMCTRNYLDSMGDFKGAYLIGQSSCKERQILFQQYEDRLVINRLMFDIFPDDRVLYLMNIYFKFCNEKGLINHTV